jgi:hypothetical protein
MLSKTEVSKHYKEHKIRITIHLNRKQVQDGDFFTEIKL